MTDTMLSARKTVQDGIAPGLHLIRSLLDALDQEAVIYCYWKFSGRVGAALAGDKDLDILIARADQHRAARVLAACGLKLFPSVACRDHPAVLSYVGFDEPSGRLLHVHVHLRLVVGETLIKNYRLPWESELLARAVPHPQFPVRTLDPASEALVLLVRACLEPSLLDPLTASRWSATLAQFGDDLRACAAATDSQDFLVLARDLLGPALADALFEALVAADPLRSRRRLRRMLESRLAGQRLYNRVEARCRGFARAALGIVGRLNRSVLHKPRPWSRRAPGGGCVIAIIGLDGSGKTTLVRTIRQWLTPEVDVMPIYFGTGDGRPSLVLMPFKLLLPMAERLFRSKPRGSSHGNVTKRAPGLLYTTLLTVWATMVSLDKRIKLVRARRAANRGMVVVADRYPQNEIQRFNDGPLLPRLGLVPGVLRRFEAAAYERATDMPPDLVLKLVVTPETAARREPDMDRGVIGERIVQLRRLALPGARVVCIDAEQPLPDVICAAKREIWCAL